MHDSIKREIALIEEATGLVGGAYALIKKGEISEMECFGMADKEAGRPVTARSFFDLASNSKAFSTMLGAIGEDEGVFSWDAPIREYMPEFDMVDPYIASHITGRDLASHRTGLGRHEFMRAKVDSTMENMVLRTKYMEMAHGFRDKYEYNNHMFIVLGYILSRAFKKPWEELIVEKITDPLGMEVRFRKNKWDNAGLDCALPYRTDGNGGAYRTEYANSNVSGPAGGLKTNLEGMIKWLQCLTGSGRGLCSEKAFAELTKTNIPCNEDSVPWELAKGYSLGWHTSAYRRRYLVSHGGSVSGFNSNVGFFPGENEGFVVLTNTGSAAGAYMLRTVLLDVLSGVRIPDYGFQIEGWKREMSSLDTALLDFRAGRKLTDEEFAALAGSYYHPAYDDFSIIRENGDVWVDYGQFRERVRICKDGTALACEEAAAPSFLRMRVAEGGLLANNSDCDMWLMFKKL